MNINLDGSGRVVAAEKQEFKFQTSTRKSLLVVMVRGSDLVVTAIWEGRQAAEGILDTLAFNKLIFKSLKKAYFK